MATDHDPYCDDGSCTTCFPQSAAQENDPAFWGNAPVPDIPMANPTGRGVHSAQPDAQTGPASQIGYCLTCGWDIKLVPGDHWVHSRTGNIVGSGTGPYKPPDSGSR